MHSSEFEGGGTCSNRKKKGDHLHPPDVVEVRKTISMADEHDEGKMTIFKIGDTTPFLFETKY